MSKVNSAALEVIGRGFLVQFLWSLVRCVSLCRCGESSPLSRVHLSERSTAMKTKQTAASALMGYKLCNTSAV